MGIFTLSVSSAIAARDNGRVITKLGAARNDIDGAYRISGTVATAQNFKGQLRNAVAKSRQGQMFKYNVGQAPIGWGRTSAFDVFNQAVGQLAFTALVKACGERLNVNQLAIGPHPANAINLALA